MGSSIKYCILLLNLGGTSLPCVGAARASTVEDEDPRL